MWLIARIGLSRFLHDFGPSHTHQTGTDWNRETESIVISLIMSQQTVSKRF